MWSFSELVKMLRRGEEKPSKGNFSGNLDLVMSVGGQQRVVITDPKRYQEYEAEFDAKRWCSQRS